MRLDYLLYIRLTKTKQNKTKYLLTNQKEEEPMGRFKIVELMSSSEFSLQFSRKSFVGLPLKFSFKTRFFIRKYVRSAAVKSINNGIFGIVNCVYNCTEAKNI